MKYTELAWRKSSRSNSDPNQCVELADAGRRVAVRDSKNPAQGHFEVGRRSFRTLAERVKAGEYDL